MSLSWMLLIMEDPSRAFYSHSHSLCSKGSTITTLVSVGFDVQEVFKFGKVQTR